jgi:hypothetical protein
MKREVWALAEAWITVWLEVTGAKSGNVLLAAKYIRDVSLSERPTVIFKQQPGVSQESPVVNSSRVTFQFSKDLLSKAETAAITDPTKQYWIEVSMVNPSYDGITQVDDLYQLKTCTMTTKGFQAQDNDMFGEEIAYNVREVA